MILKNKLTKEVVDVSYKDFRKRFSKEIQDAYESFKQTELAKTFYNFQDDNLLESDFYFQLRWNFNNHGNSNWYIESL